MGQVEVLGSCEGDVFSVFKTEDEAVNFMNEMIKDDPELFPNEDAFWIGTYDVDFEIVDDKIIDIENKLLFKIIETKCRLDHAINIIKTIEMDETIVDRGVLFTIKTTSMLLDDLESDLAQTARDIIAELKKN